MIIKLTKFKISTVSEQYNKNSCFRGVDGQTQATVPPPIPVNTAWYICIAKKKNETERKEKEILYFNLTITVEHPATQIV